MILFRYLAKEILITMFAVSVTLLLITMTSRFVKYLAQAASGDLAPEVVLTIMFYRLPSFLELVLPLGLFIGILLSYGRLYVESEMTVMSACGLSTQRLAVYTLLPSLLVAAVVGWLTLYASPAGIAKVQEIFQDAKNSSSLELLVAGRFRVEEKTGRVSYIQDLSEDRRTMQQVFSAQQSKTPEGMELSVVFAKEGEIQVNPQDNSRYLVLSDGYQYVGRPGGRAYRVTEFEQFGQLLEEPEPEDKRYKEADARSTEYLLQSQRPEDRATLQWRFSLILLVPVIALIAQALSRTDHRRGRYVKMLPAFLVYIFYLVFLNGARESVSKGSEFGIWWVHGLFLLLALGLLFGGSLLRQWRRWRSQGGGVS